MTAVRTASLRWFPVALTVMLAACSSSSTGTPEGFSVSAAGFDALLFRWSPPRGGADSYDLDGRVGNDPWEEVQHGIPSDIVAGTLSLNPATPELLAFGFRLRAVKGGKASGWTETTFFRGVRPPAITGTAVAVAGDGYTRTGPITVTWQNLSSIATEVQVERGAQPASGAYVALPAAFGATSYVDDEAVEATLYEYRVRYGAAGTWSDWATRTTTEAIDLLLPTQLTVTPLGSGEGVRVSWTPRSTRSNYQYVSRWPAWPGGGDSLPQVSPTTSELVDLLPSYWPVLRYQVVTVRTDYFPSTVWGDVAFVQPFTLLGPPALRASSRSLMAGESFARDAQGGFHVGSQGLAQPFVSRATAAGSEVHALDGFVYNKGPPRLGVDGGDHLHAIYARVGASPSGPPIVTHEWHDGTAWQREDVPVSMPGDTTAAMFWAGVARTGAVHVVVSDTSGAAQHAFKEAGTWSTGTILAGGFDLFLGLQFGVASDGTAYTLTTGEVGSISEWHLRVRPPGGAWGGEVAIPGATSSSDAWLVPADAGNAAVVYGVSGADVFSTDLFFTRRQGTGGFSTPELVVNRPFNGSSFAVWPASSADGTYAAFAVDISPDASTPAKTRLLVRDAAGTWSQTTPGPGTARSWLLGFDATGKLWALGNFSWLDPTPVPYAVFEELN
jgi:hypothetical protein